jgi:iron(II)-dependent oxidoreductase
MRATAMWTAGLGLLIVVSTLAGVSHADDAEPAEVPGDSTPEAAVQAELILIPAGEYMMGDTSAGDHSPAHKVWIDSFYIDRYEVTNAQYYEFCMATEHRLPEFWGMDEFRSGPAYPDHPVIGVSFYDATAYAEWAGKRLPTEAEWEYAARGGVVGMPYVVGETLDPVLANYARSGTGGPLKVGTYGPNGYGLYDMCGNVVEWVADRYGSEYYSASPDSNPRGPEKGRFIVIRGGGWHTGPGCCRVFFRNALPSNWLDFNVGFRCARDLHPQ